MPKRSIHRFVQFSGRSGLCFGSRGLLGLAAFAAALSACSDQPYDPDAPAIDPDAPVVHIVTPARGTFAGDVATLAVSGTARDDHEVVSVEVNGVAASLTSDGNWTATVPVVAGTQLIHAIARDAQGNAGKESRAVAVGATRSFAQPVPRAITASLSAQTFDAVGRGLTGLLRSGDLAAAIAPRNPVFAVGSAPLSATGSITQMATGPATQVSLRLVQGGLAIEAELDQVAMGMHVAYALGPIEDASDVSLTARHIRVAGVLQVAATAGKLDIKLTNAQVALTGLSLTLTGLPGDIVRLLHLDTALGPVLAAVIEQLAVPVLSAALATLDDQRTIEVLGRPVELTLAPTRVSFAPAGALVELDTTLRARDAAGAGYIYVANAAPALALGGGFALAVADDAANQLLGSLWAARGLEIGIDLTTGSYGPIGKLYDRVELSAKVPPFVDARGGALGLTIGDLVATFTQGGQVTTEVVVNAEVAINVVAGADGAPRLDVGTPTTHVDVLDQGVVGANTLSNAQFELITSFALGRALSVGSGAIGAIPLPAVGGVAVRDLAVTPGAGYLMVAGEVR